jgi:arsenical pump membrane protein
MPFLFGCGFAANTASFGLPFANPANILVIPRPHVLEYLAHLGLPQVAAIAINLALFLVVFRGRLDGRYDGAEEEARHPAAAARTLLTACLVAAAYVVAMLLRAPLGPVALLGAVAMMCVARVPVRRVLPHIGWSIFVVLAALFALVDVLGRAGFFGWALGGLDDAMRYGTLAGVAAATLGTAALAALLNNLPVAVGAQFVAAHASWPHVAYALVAGVDLGPNLLTTASLSTILWLNALRRRGVRMSALEYARLGIIVVPPMLLATILWLWAAR